MSTPPGNAGTRSGLAAIGVVAAMALCCGLALLIVAGVLGSIGAVLGNPWVIGAAVLLVLALIGWRVRHHISRSADDACCPPQPHDHHRSDPNPQPPHHRKEP